MGEEFVATGDEARTWNGAVTNATVGEGKYAPILSYFAKAGTYVGRDQKTVDADMASIFSDEPFTALKVLFGLRLVTRSFDDIGTEDVQTGYGRRDEFYKGVVWLLKNKPEAFYNNLHLIPVFGCWKDLLQEPLIDAVDRNKVYALVKENLEDHLLRKYLPQIRSKNNLRTARDTKRSQWAEGLCRYLGITHKDYRSLKAHGTAHTWQQQMSAKKWTDIDFKRIPGKAMLNHTSQKGRDKQTVFERHGLVERLKEWVLSQGTVKFTGYPYQLFQAARKSPSLVQRLVYDRQFQSVLKTMEGHKLGNVLACLDTSGSMSWTNFNGVTPYEICLSMGLVFSSMNTGYFKDTVCAFSNHSEVKKLTGDFCQRVEQVCSMHAMGGTNFQSVIDLLVRVRRENPEIPANEYPETLVVISDMQFNPVGNNVQTNYQAAMEKLNAVGLENTRIIWWHVNGAAKDFPGQMNDRGVYMISGFDPVNIKALMGLSSSGKKDFVAAEKVEETPLDGLLNFIDQPIFTLLK